MKAKLAGLGLVLSCATSGGPLPLRAPLVVDTDTHPVSVACRPEPSKQEPDRARCAPAEYVSAFVWDAVDNAWFAPLSRVLSIEVSGEAANATSLDEVADSAWFQNRIGVAPLSNQQQNLGACQPEDILPADVADGAWIIDQGKVNGTTHGFRIDVPGKGRYMLKADDDARRQPERGSAASVIGAALYNAAGFNTTCEQIVWIRRAQLTLEPHLTMADNAGIQLPFGEAALDEVLAGSTHAGELVRMQASKWLPGLSLGPFRYFGTRGDDPNDIIAHEDRRELRGSRLLAAWVDHWDAREQNSMDVWLASDAKNIRSSAGYVRHYILDLSDTLGGDLKAPALAPRLGHAYIASIGDVVGDLFSFGVFDRPWQRAQVTPGREKFGLFSERDFDPEAWVGVYPNPAMLRMTERDGAWMARIISRFTEADIRAIVTSGRFADPGDTDYIVKVLIERQRLILARYLTRLSPLANMHAVGTDQICATDLARSSGVWAADRFHYQVIERSGGKRLELAATPAADGVVCFRPRSLAPQDGPDAARERITIFEVRNGTTAGPLEIHAYDLGTRGMYVVGVTRPLP